MTPPAPRERRRALLATSSLISFAVGTALVPLGARPAAAACAVAVTGASGTVSNAGTINCISVNGAAVGGNVTNSGTITTNGISITSSVIVGAVIDTGPTVVGGISIGNLSTVNNTASGGQAGLFAVQVFGSINQLTTITFTGGITNAGTITPKGDGIFVGSGVSTFGGGITNTGSIASGGGIFVGEALSTFSGGITNGGTIIGQQGAVTLTHIGTFLNGVTNTGFLTATGPGTAVNITTMTTFTGGILNSGTITSGRNALGVSTISNFSGGLTNNGTISGAGSFGVFIGVAIGTFSGGLTNNGTITAVTDAISIGRGGVASFIGGITNSGTISGGVAISLTDVTGSISGATIFNDGTLIGTGGTAIAFGGGTNTLTLGPGYAITGNVLGHGADTLQLGGASGTATFNLSNIGSGQQYQGFTTFTEVGGATWTATGTFTQNQAWTVQSGTLLVTGDLSQASSVTVDSGGVLGGTGTVSGTIISSGGTLMPGLPGTVGTLTVKGNLVFGTGSAYLITINGVNASSTSVTTGGATLGGASVQIATGSTITLGHTYTILTAIGGLFGSQFNPTVTFNGFVGTLTYDPDDVFLTFANAPPPPPPPTMLVLPSSATTNERSPANAINGAIVSGVTLPSGFAGLLGLQSTQLLAVLDQLSGEAATGAELSSFQLMSQYLGLLTGPFGQGHGNAFGGPGMAFAPQQEPALPPEIASAYAAVFKGPPAATAPRYSIWAAPFGGAGTDRGDPFVVGSRDVTAHTGGFAAGVDYRVSPDTVLGFSLAGGGTSWSLSAGLGGGSSDVFLAGVYASQQFGAAYFSGALAFADFWMKTSRTVTVAGTDQLNASFNAQDVGGRLEAGYHVVGWAPFRLTPYAAAQAQVFRSPAYNETAASGSAQFALGFNAQNATATRGELGGWVDESFAMGERGRLTLFGRAAWAHDWVSNPALTPTFLGLPTATFVVNGAAPPRDLALATAGAEMRWGDGWSVMGRFDGELAAHAQTYTGTARLRYAW